MEVIMGAGGKERRHELFGEGEEASVRLENNAEDMR
jgi:hypothetical protein